MFSDLKGKLVLITSCTGGVGQAIARAFARSGCSVAAHYQAASSRAKADTLISDLKAIASSDVRFAAFQADLSNYDEVRRLYAEVVLQIGHPDILFANHGIAGPEIGPQGDIKDMPMEVFEETWRTNTGTSYVLAQLRVPLTEAQKHGRVIFTSSVAASTRWRDAAPRARPRRLSPHFAIAAAGHAAVALFPTHTRADARAHEEQQSEAGAGLAWWVTRAYQRAAPGAHKPAGKPAAGAGVREGAGAGTREGTDAGLSPHPYATAPSPGRYRAAAYGRSSPVPPNSGAPLVNGNGTGARNTNTSESFVYAQTPQGKGTDSREDTMAGANRVEPNSFGVGARGMSAEHVRPRADDEGRGAGDKYFM